MTQTVQEFIKKTVAFSERGEYIKALDLEFMACSLLGIERSKLFSSSITLEKKDKTKFLSMIRRRNKGEPLAYILGSKGFWNLDIEVNNKVLVPRPETEIIVEDILLNFNQKYLNVLDLGTGSGAIGLSLKKENSSLDIVANQESSADC